MHGTVPPLPQYALMAWFSVKAQGLYQTNIILLQAKIVASRLTAVSASSKPYLKERMPVEKLGRCS